MGCFSPLEGWRRKPTPERKGGFTTNVRHALLDQRLTVPCGQCIGCRLERSRQWAIRCVHEAQQHEESIFATLTYNDENLPYRGSLHRPDIQNFFKRLRKKTPPIRVFYCGEYGENLSRPHYHALIFGFRPGDAEQKTRGDFPIYESELLSQTWGLGHANFGNVTFDSAAYVAGYCTKKITGDAADSHYTRSDPETGEVYKLVPEFNGSSRKPPIGGRWLQEHGRDTYKKDALIMRDREMRPPRAYDKMMEELDYELYETAKKKRLLEGAAAQHRQNLDPYLGSYLHFKARDKIARQKTNQRKLNENLRD